MDSSISRGEEEEEGGGGGGAAPQNVHCFSGLDRLYIFVVLLFIKCHITVL